MGIGMALHEETMADHRIGRIMNHNFAEYQVPDHADVEDIEVIFVDEPDPKGNQFGIKGVGEIGIVGTAAAMSMSFTMAWRWLGASFTSADATGASAASARKRGR